MPETNLHSAPAKKPFPKKSMIIIGVSAAVAIIVALVIIFSAASRGNTATQNNPGQFSYLPDNTCPQSVFVENGQNRADYNGKPYLISNSQKEWARNNCNVPGLSRSSISSNSNTSSLQPPTSSQAAAETQPPLLLGSVGFNFADYNPATGKAGDIVFTKTKLPFDMIYGVFGQQDPRSPNDPSKRNPQPTVILPIGTKVLSLVTGEVVEVKQLYSGDMTVWVAKDKNSTYFYETEHIKNPTVKVGDKVTAGQIIGEVSDYDSQNNPGFGLIEIGILHSRTDGGAPEHLCPLNYLDPKIKDKTLSSLTKLYSAWNQYLGKEIYKYSTFANPGCVVLDAVEG